MTRLMFQLISATAISSVAASALAAPNVNTLVINDPTHTRVTHVRQSGSSNEISGVVNDRFC